MQNSDASAWGWQLLPALWFMLGALSPWISHALAADSPGPTNPAPSLMEVYAAAEKASPRLKALAQGGLALQRELEGLQGQRWVNLDAALISSHTLSTNKDNTNIQTGLQLTNTFDIANRTGFDVQLKEYARLRNAYRLQLERKQLFLAVATDYYRLLFARRLLAMHQLSASQLQAQAGQLSQSVTLGKTAAIDRDRLRVELLSQQNQLVQDRLEVTHRLQNLRFASGLDLGPTALPGTGLLTLEAPPAGAEQSLPSGRDALEAAFVQNAPELHLLVMDRQSEEVNLHKEEASWYPSLSVSALYQLSTFTLGPEALEQTSANLSFKLLDGGRALRIAAQQARVRAAELEYAQQERTLRNQFLNAWAELQALAERLQAQHQALLQARANRERLWEGYRRQFVDLTTLLTANRDWLTLEADYCDQLARYDELSAGLRHQSQGDIYR